MYGVSIRHVQDIYGVCVGDVWDLYGMCKDWGIYSLFKVCSGIQTVSVGYIWGIFKACVGYV